MKNLNIKHTIEIFIDEIDVEEYEYQINYRYKINNEKEKHCVYGSDYEGWTVKEWEKELKNGEAFKDVLGKISEELYD